MIFLCFFEAVTVSKVTLHIRTKLYFKVYGFCDKCNEKHTCICSTWFNLKAARVDCYDIVDQYSRMSTSQNNDLISYILYLCLLTYLLLMSYLNFSIHKLQQTLILWLMYAMVLNI